jgi:predicted DNA-binding transcriptional regulator YafY
MVRPEEDGVRAAAESLRAAHRRVDAEAARLVVGGRHHTATPGIAADDEGTIDQLGMLELLDGGEKRVQVQVGDDERHGAGRIGTLSHDTDKLIRQLSLVAFLMAERRPLTAREIKSTVEGYSEMSDEAFARRFYSDRSELLALGVPLHSQRDEFTGEELYTLRSEQYFLPAFELTDDELAALQTALYLLEGQFAYSEPLRLALQNLALGRPTELEATTGSAVRVELRDPDYSAEMSGRLTKLEGAISKQRTIKFPYWTLSRDTESERTVNPYALLPERGSWYLIGFDLNRNAVRTFRVSRIRGEIRFATRRERDFRMPADGFDLAEYRGREQWQFGDPVGEAEIELDPDTAWWAERTVERGTVEDGLFRTPYADLDVLAGWVLGQEGRARPVAPPELVEKVEEGVARVLERHQGEPTKPPRARARPEAEPLERPAGPVAPERFGVLQALLAHLLARCGDESRATIPAQELVDRFHIPPDQLEDHLQLLNLVNFGGGCYAVYARLDGDQVHVDKELFGDAFRRPPRLTPLEARAIRLALEFVGPMIAAEAQTPLDRVRRKLEETFGAFDVPEASEGESGSAAEDLIRTFSQAIREQRLVEIEYVAVGEEKSVRTVEPYQFRRELPNWYVHTWDRTRAGERSFRLDRMHAAKLLDERFEPRPGLEARMLQDVHVARVLFDPEAALRRLERGAAPLARGYALEDLAFGSTDWAVGEILSHCGHAEVLEPRSLRREIAARARKLKTTLAKRPARARG